MGGTSSPGSDEIGMEVEVVASGTRSLVVVVITTPVGDVAGDVTVAVPALYASSLTLFVEYPQPILLN